MSKRSANVLENNNISDVVNSDIMVGLKRKKRDHIEDKNSKRLKKEKGLLNISKWRLLKFQSPIKMYRKDCVSYDNFKSLEFDGFWNTNAEGALTNNGSTVMFRFITDQLPILSGGPLGNDKFSFENLHFHWGSNDEDGCEHILDEQGYSMEVHLVHYNKKYLNFENACEKPDGLAVLAFFLQATDGVNNEDFTKFSKSVTQVIRKNSSIALSSDSLKWIHGAFQCKGYYTYQGSLTTEPYSESVTWIIFPTPVQISRKQVANFRKLESHCCEKNYIANNVRPVQIPPESKKINVIFVNSHR